MTTATKEQDLLELAKRRYQDQVKKHGDDDNWAAAMLAELRKQRSEALAGGDIRELFVVSVLPGESVPRVGRGAGAAGAGHASGGVMSETRDLSGGVGIGAAIDAVEVALKEVDVAGVDPALSSHEDAQCAALVLTEALELMGRVRAKLRLARALASYAAQDRSG